MPSCIISKEVGKAGVLVLNRPQRLNAINFNMIKWVLPYSVWSPSLKSSHHSRCLSGTLMKWENEKEFIIIKGAGERAFCSGADLFDIIDRESETNKKFNHFLNQVYGVNLLIGSYKIPYISIMNGITMGGGVGLSIHGCYRIATEKTKWAMPEIRLGYFPDVGASYFLPRLPKRLGYYLGLTGHTIGGDEVYNAGIATHYIKSNNLQEIEVKLLECRSPQEVDGVMVEYCNKVCIKTELDEELPHIEKCFCASTMEEIVENLEKDNSKWAHATLGELSKIRPTSLKVTLRQLQRGARMNLIDCMKMEKRLATHHYQDSKFHDNVRTLFIERSSAPKWHPSTLCEVSDELVNSYFKRLPPEQELRFKRKLTDWDLSFESEAFATQLILRWNPGDGGSEIENMKN